MLNSLVIIEVKIIFFYGQLRERKKEKSEIAVGINEERKNMKYPIDTEN